MAASFWAIYLYCEMMIRNLTACFLSMLQRFLYTIIEYNIKRELNTRKQKKFQTYHVRQKKTKDLNETIKFYQNSEFTKNTRRTEHGALEDISGMGQGHPRSPSNC